MTASELTEDDIKAAHAAADSAPPASPELIQTLKNIFKDQK